jgi:hypothetical protein
VVIFIHAARSFSTTEGRQHELLHSMVTGYIVSCTVIIFHPQVCARSLNSELIVRMRLSSARRHHLSCFSLATAGPLVEKLRAAWVKIATAGVLRLRATRAVSRDQSVRRCAQDDNSVGELTERRPLCGSRGALQIPRLAEFRVGELHAVFSYGKPHTWMCIEAAWQEIRLRFRMTILWEFDQKHPRQVSVDGAKRHQRHCLNSVRTDSYSRTLIPKLFILRYK